MKTSYQILVILRWLCLLWLPGLSVSLKAQTTSPPVFQWQQVIEGGIDFSSRAKLAKTSTGDFGILNGTFLAYMSPSGLLKSVAALEGSIQKNATEYTKVVATAGLVPTADGGFLVLANDSSNLYVIKKDAANNRLWSSIIRPSVYGSSAEQYLGVDILPATGGNYLVFASHPVQGTVGNTNVTKITGTGTIVWSKDIFFSEASSPTGVVGRGYGRVVASSDGSYVLTGIQFSPLSRPQIYRALAAKIDGDGTLIWARSYGDLVTFSDHVVNPFDAGTFFILGSTDPSLNGTLAGPTATYKLLVNGALEKIGTATVNGNSRIASDGSGFPGYVILEPIPDNGGDFKLTGRSPLNEPLWTKTLGGSAYDFPQAILPTGDGYLLGGVTLSSDGDVKGKLGNALATWLVKLSKLPIPLAMTQPTYNCQTGAITFTVSGGDGSPITYSAPGIARASATDNFGTVEAGLRADPKVIPITATQSGVSVTYNFDLNAACNTAPVPKLPILTQPLPDYALTFGFSLGDAGLPIGQYFFDPTTNVPNYKPDWVFKVEGLPSGLFVSSQPMDLLNSARPGIKIAGNPGRSGVFTITVTASTGAFRNFPIVDDFVIVVSGSNPPPGSTLVLTEPTYNCLTGDIMFNTRGGDNTPITYIAPGIARALATDNVGKVEAGLRADPKVIPITAMQSGVSVTYNFDLKATCSRARVGADEPGTGLHVRVLGNPIVSRTAEVEITGVAGQQVQLDLVDGQGRSLHQQTIDQASSPEPVSIPIGQRNGLFLLQIRTAKEHQTVKLLKP